MKKIEKLTATVRSETLEAMREAARQDKTRVLKLVDYTEDIQVDVDIDGEEATVCVYNRNNLGRYYPNIEAAILGSLPRWDETEQPEDPWGHNGFASGHDYLRWRHGA